MTEPRTSGLSERLRAAVDRARLTPEQLAERTERPDPSLSTEDRRALYARAIRVASGEEEP